MSNHPIIKALKARLESERLNEQKQWANATFPPLNIQTTKDFTQDVNFARREVHALAYKAGHEAASARLLSIVERALEVIDVAEELATHPAVFSEAELRNESLKVRRDKFMKLSQEFLTTLADASGESKNES